MTTTVIYASTADAYINSNDASYATAAAGTGTISAIENSELHVGQFPTYFVRQTFLGFDTSAIDDADTVSQVDLELYGKQNSSSTDFDITALSYDWGGSVTTADWRTPVQLAALTSLATLNTASYSISAYNTLTSAGAAFNSWVNKTGTSYLMVVSSQNISGTTPTADAFIVLYSTAAAGTTQDPKITVTHASSSVEIAVGLATETDTAFGLALQMGLGRADETDTALALSASLVVPTGIATETDTALGLAIAVGVGRADETDTALALDVSTGAVVIDVGMATEADTALGLGMAVAVGLATETDTALALSLYSAPTTTTGTFSRFIQPFAA